MAFVVLYDANVLYPSTLRDLLIRIAQSGMVQAKWTDQILDEVFDSLTRQRPNLDSRRLARTRELMCRAVRDCLVVGYEPLIESLTLPDPDDRHVLAAAIKSRSQVIVTNNVRDFPADVLAPWNIETKAPDDFVLDQDRPRHRGHPRGPATDRRLLEEPSRTRRRRPAQVGARRPAPVRRAPADMTSSAGLRRPSRLPQGHRFRRM